MTSDQRNPGETDHPAEDHAPAGEDLAAILTRLIEETPDKTQKDLATEAGVPYPTLNAWLKRTRGTSRVPSETLHALADTLRKWGVAVTARELFEAVRRPVPGPSDEERERRLLEIYRQLDVSGQRALIEHARLLRTSRASSP
ncbi:helix-turn-helix domain-containing protein [Streptomyces pacificus]|uniref:Helix-turn-helix domain-containing protein n=1 Tax=Streptomyces pacificus TaxID=2705029 RepID=A0A6A0AUN2_9ACTN|nr:helix-turn-helix transcriptional regulator [Streptomyces pacificus]GFH36576.1 helix-turn-helix domain-containing protein [Streptomyces pacificus]